MNVFEQRGELRIYSEAQKISARFHKNFADCVLVTKDQRLLLQERPRLVSLFGGHIEEGETPLQGVLREIEEEVCAKMPVNELVFLGGVAEADTDYTELVSVYFWHDTYGLIGECREWSPLFFDRLEDALAHPLLMPYARWALQEADRKGLLKAMEFPPSREGRPF